MPVNRKTESGNYRVGKIFQACSIQSGVCQDRPYFGETTQTMGVQTAQQKSKEWVLLKYFKSENNRNWVFKDTCEFEGKKQTFTLKKLADIPIRRHVKIKKDANPFDPKWDGYFENRSK